MSISRAPNCDSMRQCRGFARLHVKGAFTMVVARKVEPNKGERRNVEMACNVAFVTQERIAGDI